jgi:hypothetical protein
MNSKIFNFLLFAFAFLFLSGCLKKGEDDPAISLRSRKARVVGKWKIKSGRLTLNNFFINNDTVLSDINIVYTSNSYQTERKASNSSYGNYNTTSLGSLSYVFEFKKDGGFSSTYIADGTYTNKIIGKWNFTGNVGDQKNKDQIVINITSNFVTAPGPLIDSSIYTGNTSDYTYSIKELRNNKLVLTSFTSYDNGQNTSKNSRSTELVFEK